MERNVNMKTIVRMGSHCVVRGMDINEYAQLVGLPIEVENYDELREALDLKCESSGGADPLWDFPLDELEEREDEDYFFVELFDGSEPRYFETLIPVTEIKEVL